MRFSVKKSTEINILHSLKGLPENHKCSKLHGHNYTVIVCISAAKVNKVGMVYDFISNIVKTFDQVNLNESIEPATPEIFCQTLLDIFEMEITSAEMSARDMRIESIVVQDGDSEFRYSR